MLLPGRTWERLYEIALDQYGFVTSKDADALGLPSSHLGIMRRRGLLENIGYGLYRFPQVPVTDRTEYMQAVLWVGEDAALSHDAVLALHGLASANPRAIRIVTPHRVRRTQAAPGAITIVQEQVPTQQLTTYFGIPSTTVARALIDCRNLIMHSRLRSGADEARKEGLLLAAEHEWVIEELETSR